MKSSGIVLIGLGAYSTQYYVQRLKQIALEIKELKGFQPKEYPLNFERINPHLPSHFSELLPLIEPPFREIVNQSTSQILVPNMTLHLAIDQLHFTPEQQARFIHPFRLAVSYLKSNNIENITILGSVYSMKAHIFDHYFKDFTLTKVSAKDSKAIDDMRLAVYNNGPNSTLRKRFLELASKYKNPVLCCTELSVVNPLDLNFIDLVDLQCKQAIKDI